MKKLKIDKIKLSDMSEKDQVNLVGGAVETDNCVTPTTVTITVPILVGPYISGFLGCESNDCFSKKPGEQDSCGLCTTTYRCDETL